MSNKIKSGRSLPFNMVSAFVPDGSSNDFPTIFYDTLDYIDGKNSSSSTTSIKGLCSDIMITPASTKCVSMEKSTFPIITLT